MKTSEFRKLIREEVRKVLKEDNTADLNALEQKLRSHDWYYMYSDDHSAYLEGSQEASDIQALVDKLGEEGRELYQQAFYKHFKRS